MQSGQNIPSSTFVAHGASRALGAHGCLGAAPLATNCWPKAHGERGGGGGVVGVQGPAESPPPPKGTFHGPHKSIHNHSQQGEWRRLLHPGAPQHRTKSHRYAMLPPILVWHTCSIFPHLLHSVLDITPTAYLQYMTNNIGNTSCTLHINPATASLNLPSQWITVVGFRILFVDTKAPACFKQFTKISVVFLVLWFPTLMTNTSSI